MRNILTPKAVGEVTAARAQATAAAVVAAAAPQRQQQSQAHRSDQDIVVIGMLLGVARCTEPGVRHHEALMTRDMDSFAPLILGRCFTLGAMEEPRPRAG